MKNKKLTYLLVPAVMVVWGLIIHRVTDALGGPTPDDTRPVSATERPPAFAMPDTVVLGLGYRDPFLGSAEASVRTDPPVRRVTQSARAAVSPPPPVVTAPPVPQAPWPAIQYMGVIQNSASKARVALIRVNGKSHLLGEGKQVEGVTVTVIAADSVGLAFGGLRKYVRK